MTNVVNEYLNHQPFPLFLLRPEEAKRYPVLLPQPSLDVGCGDGFFAKSVFGKQGITIGMDINPTVIDKAKQNGAYKYLAIFNGGHIPLPDNSQQTVIANCVLEHVDYPFKLLAEISRVLKTSGKFYFSVPTTNFESLLFGSRLLKRLHLPSISKKYQRFMSWVTRQKYYWSIAKWQKVLSQVGFKIESKEEFFGQKPLWYFDISHWMSVPSILTKICLGRWILFPNLSIKNKLLLRLRQHIIEEPSFPGAFQFFICRKTRS